MLVSHNAKILARCKFGWRLQYSAPQTQARGHGLPRLQRYKTVDNVMKRTILNTKAAAHGPQRRSTVPASVKDVAAAAGVSASTVSNYLNHPEVLSARSTERVRAAIERLGYVPNESARQLRAGAGKAIALILLDAWLPYFSELSRGVEDVTREDGWSLFFSNSGRDAQQEQRNIDMFEAHRARGIIIYPLGEVTPRLEQLNRRGIRSVIVGPAHGAPSIGSVPFDDHGGGMLAGRHLLETGRRRIVFIGDPAAAQTAERLAGLRAATAGTDAEVSVIEEAGFTMTTGLRAAERLLQASQRPDAVFAANDMVAIGVQTALLRAGISVPDDVAIVGFDDVVEAPQALVPLTTIRQPAYEIGRAAASTLLHRLEHPSEPFPAAAPPFAAELVVRASTGRA